jgi:photosystem II stability/assembly factor-like uncharacterized protein
MIMRISNFISTQWKGISHAVRTSNDGWQVAHRLENTQVHCLCLDPHQAGVIYAGTQDQGILRSDDGGVTWQPLGLSDQVIRALAVAPTQPGVIYAGTRPVRLFKSDDGGNRWGELREFQRVRGWWWFSPADKPYTAYVQAIALSPTDPNVVVVGIELGGVLLSADGGQTWSRHRRCALRDCHSMVFHVSAGNWVYECGGSGGGVAVSQDAGMTWRKFKAGLDVHYGWTINADPENPQLIYASLAPGPFKAHVDGKAEAFIFRSRDGGAWEKLGGGLSQPLRYMPYALLIDPTAPGHVYAGLSNGDIWHTTDYGDHWEKLPFNLGGIHRALVMF